ncbi:MAG: DCC1-like thiol-disulfide oxidoreductase family protein [Bacteriovorax sp.]|nr:DCC1-like thiol-disulfide oxidoreductase family protein [Bacteriovorax sp.]
MAIVFYDGECGLCQRSIQFLYKADKKKQLFFAPLNGMTYRQIYGEIPAAMTSVKLYLDGESFEKSSAVIKLCALLGWPSKIFTLLSIFPKFLRDFFYDQVALQRKRLSCLLLIKDERFLE